MAYVEAIGFAIGHDATAEEARAMCPEDCRVWRDAFTAAYGDDPVDDADGGNGGATRQADTSRDTTASEPHETR